MKTFALILLLCVGCAGPNPQPIIKQSQTVVAPPTNTVVFQIFYDHAITNEWIESSTDLVKWVRRDDVTIDPDGMKRLHDDPSQGNQFYRGGGETIQ